jgi:hypothetical protein
MQPISHMDQQGLSLHRKFFKWLFFFLLLSIKYKFVKVSPVRKLTKAVYYFTTGMLAIVIADLVQVLHTNRLILQMCKNKPQKFFYLLFSHQCVCCWNRKRVFILGPSHHVRLSGCALSSVAKYRTPFYDLTIDTQGKFIFHNFVRENI